MSYSKALKAFFQGNSGFILKPNCLKFTLDLTLINQIVYKISTN